MYPVDGEPSNLDNSTQKINKNQSLDSNTNDDKNASAWIDVQFLNFMLSIGFTENDIHTLCQYNSVGSSGYKKAVDLEKSCGCSVTISDKDNCIAVQLCDEHLKNVVSFYMSESDAVADRAANNESNSDIKTENITSDAKPDKITKKSDNIEDCEDNITLADIRLEDIDNIDQ